MKDDRGFTYSELMIVVVIVASLAAVAVPNVLRSRMAASEAEVVAQLRRVAVQEGIYKTSLETDQDEDGIGEHGFLCELSGELPPRKRKGFAEVPAAPVHPAYLPDALHTRGAGGDGTAAHSGYRFRLFLAATCRCNDRPGDAMDDRGSGCRAGRWGEALDATTDRPQINMQENSFCLYAWPDLSLAGGTRAFFVNELGRIRSTTMTVTPYLGKGRDVRDYRAAYSAAAQDGDGCWDDLLAEGEHNRGHDDNIWQPAG
ncbi:MAG: prepilin-type N-terminal cleavage/methylation domain-containing protein [Planctomycetota bacterium]